MVTDGIGEIMGFGATYPDLVKKMWIKTYESCWDWFDMAIGGFRDISVCNSIG